MNLKSSDYSNIKKAYLKFLKKREVAGKPIIDKIGKLKRFYLTLSKWIYITYKKYNKHKWSNAKNIDYLYNVIYKPNRLVKFQTTNNYTHVHSYGPFESYLRTHLSNDNVKGLDKQYKSFKKEIENSFKKEITSLRKLTNNQIKFNSTISKIISSE